MVKIREHFKRGSGQDIVGTVIKEDGRIVLVRTRDGIREILEKRISSITPLKVQERRSAHDV